MSTYKMVTVVGTSPESYEAAIRSAVADASKTLRHLDWFEVEEFRGRLESDGSVAEFQAKVRIGFRIEGEG